MKMVRLILILAAGLFFFCPAAMGNVAGEPFDLPEYAPVIPDPGEMPSGTGAGDEVVENIHDVEAVLWSMKFGGDGTDYGHSVQKTADGGYIIAGTTDSYGKGDQVFLVKTSSNGVKQWKKTFGGDGDDEGWSVQQSDDGGYIIAGTFYSNNKGNQVFLIKTHSNGVKQWKKTFGGDYDDSGRSVQQTDDGGYIVCGSRGLQVYLIKTDSNGVKQWSRMYGGISIEHGRSVQQTTDGGYIVTGYTRSFGKQYQVYLFKTNENGKMQWKRAFGGDEDDIGMSAREACDDGYIVTGYTESFGKGSQVYIVKVNADGVRQWQKTIGGESSDFGHSIRETADEGYIIVGITRSFGTSDQVYLIKTDANGKIKWFRTYGDDMNDSGWSVEQTPGGGFIIAGSSNTQEKSWQVYLIRTGPNG